MLIEIIGGSGSGKSEYAEKCCMELCPGRKYYIATMQPFDEESKQRVLRHQALRAGKQFITIECQTRLEKVKIEKDATVLLECMSNLSANEMFSPEGRKDHTSDVLMKGIEYLAARAKHLIIVTNQIFSDGIVYDETTTEYMRILAQVNNQVAQMADLVYEVVCGIPICIKNACICKTDIN